MKLCVLGDASYPHAGNWVNYFKNRGAEVHLISLQNSIGTSGIEHTIPSKQLPGFIKYPLSIGKIVSLIKSINPDIINAHFVPNYGFLSAIIGARPLVVSCFGSDVLEPPRKGILRKARIKYTLNKADLITTDGKILKDAVNKFGIPYSRILNVPIGIDTPVFKPLKKTLPPKVVYMRRLEYVCNPELFVNALPIVISQCNVKPVMLDMGSYREKIFSLVKKLGLQSKIEFVPFLSEQKLASLLGESTVYVSTSFSDSTSVTLLEAMSCGAFPVVTDIIGNREWIKNGVNGYLTPLNDPAKLADKIIKALSNPLLMEKASLKNTEIIKKYGDRYTNMGIVESAFLDLIKKYKNK
ncbi:MAG: glycosyltransferase family 4 protein [bacterium]|nr:glycosyltransferase family 4 protein [bacterium]